MFAFRKGNSVWQRGRTLAKRLPDAAANWILLVFSLGTVLSAVLQRHLLEPTQTAQHLVELNVGEAFGLAAVVSLVCATSRRSVPLTGTLIAILLISSLAWFIPEQHGIYLAMTLAGGGCLLSKRTDPQLAGVAQIWFTLSVYELWGKLLFKLVYQSIEIAEVNLIYKVGSLFFSDIRVDGASINIREDWTIVILEGCSSFHNLSLAVLIWLSILKIAEQPLSLAAFRALGTSAFLVIAINVARILAMLPSRDDYVFWHDGAGSSLVALVSVLAAVIPITLCTEARSGQFGPQSS